MKIISSSATFGFSSAYWTNDQLLNPDSPIETEEDAKYEAFNTQSFDEMKFWGGAPETNCYTHSFNSVQQNPRALFSSGNKICLTFYHKILFIHTKFLYHKKKVFSPEFSHFLIMNFWGKYSQICDQKVTKFCSENKKKIIVFSNDPKTVLLRILGPLPSPPPSQKKKFPTRQEILHF
jgi:hypothetical protein